MELINPYRMFQGVFIPNALLRFKGVSQSAKLMWGRLAQYAGEDGRCYPDFADLSEEIGLSESGARKVLKELRDANLIWIKYPKGKERLMHRRCEYFFINHEIFRQSGQVRSGLPENGHSGIPENGQCKEYPKTGSATEENHRRESCEETSLSGTIPDDVSVPQKKYHGGEDDYALARKIYDAVLVINPTAKEPSWDKWANDVRLMRERDGRTVEEIWHVFDFANRDAFWCYNIQCPETLRRQYSKLAPKAGIVRSMVPGVGADVQTSDDDGRNCDSCEWLGSDKWFCRRAKGAECDVCESYRSCSVEDPA